MNACFVVYYVLDCVTVFIAMEQKKQLSIKESTSTYSKEHNLPKLLGTLLEVILA